MKISQFALNVIRAVRTIDREIYHPAWFKWHSPFRSKATIPAATHCWVCLGGAWIASQVNKPTALYDANNPPRIPGCDSPSEYLNALEAIRKNNWTLAAEFIQAKKTPYYPQDWRSLASVNAEFQNWEEFDLFLGDIENQANELKAAGF